MKNSWATENRQPYLIFLERIHEEFASPILHVNQSPSKGTSNDVSKSAKVKIKNDLSQNTIALTGKRKILASDTINEDVHLKKCKTEIESFERLNTVNAMNNQLLDKCVTQNTDNFNMKDCKKKRKAEYNRKRYLENKNKKLKKENDKYNNIRTINNRANKKHKALLNKINLPENSIKISVEDDCKLQNIEHTQDSIIQDCKTIFPEIIKNKTKDQRYYWKHRESIIKKKNEQYYIMINRLKNMKSNIGLSNKIKTA